MSDFIANIRAQLDDGGVEARLKQLCQKQTVNLKIGDINENRLQNFLKRRHEVSAQISSAALSSMRSQIENALKNINVTINPTIGGGGVGGKGGVSGVISKQVQAAIDGVKSPGINQLFSIDPQQQSSAFQREIDGLVKDITSKGNNVVDIKIGTKTSWDKDTDQYVERLDHAIVKYNNDIGDTIQKTFRLNQASGQWAEKTASYKRGIEEANKQTKSFADTQKKVASDFQNTTKQIYKGAIDPNATKKILDTNHLEDLKNRYKAINTEIGKLSGLSGDAFTDQQVKIKGMITDLKIFRDQYRNAESSATINKAKSLDTQKSEYSAKVKGLEADVKKAGVASKELTDYLTDMNDALAKPDLDMSGMDKVVQTYTKATAEVSRLKKEASEQQTQQKVDIKKDNLLSEINSAVNQKSGLANFSKEINGAVTSVTTLKNELNNVKTAGDLSVVTEKWKALSSAFKEAEISTQKVTDINNLVAKFEDKFNDSNNNYENRFGNTKNYAIIEDNLKRIKDLQTEIEAEQDKGDQADLGLVAGNLEKINSLLSESERKLSGLEKPLGALETQIESSKVDAYMQNNTKALSKYGAELRKVKEEITQATNRGELDQALGHFKKITGQIEAEGLKGLSFGDEFKRAFKKIGEFTGIYAITKQLFQRLPREMYQAVKDVDASITELRKVSNATDKELNATFDKATVSAEKYGVAISDIIRSTADWKRLGYGMEEAEKLADATTLLQTVGDNMTQESASKAIISTLSGFKLDTTEVGRVVDLYNEVAKFWLNLR